MYTYMRYLGALIVLIILAAAVYIVQNTVALPSPIGTILYVIFIILIILLLIVIALIALDVAGVYTYRGSRT
jgi:hypothetical protein